MEETKEKKKSKRKSDGNEQASSEKKKKKKVRTSQSPVPERSGDDPKEDNEDEQGNDVGREGSPGAQGGARSSSQNENEETSHGARNETDLVGDDAEDEPDDIPHGRDDDTKQMEADKERMRQLLMTFTPEQTQRYECYRRSQLPRAYVKKIMLAAGASQVNTKMAIVMSGIAKVFVGEVVERARAMMDEKKEKGPVRPEHIREAYRQLCLAKVAPSRPTPIFK
mmetsp:Transcript_44013/g.71626  ORF Transcript_44013/g.71626 Transcript_44013/m.71626 type:complete len:224 (-) Transcript_44013:253-924(-)